MRMADGKALAENERIADHAETRIQHAERRFFAGVEVPAHLPQDDVLVEIRPLEGHEMGMNIPAVRIAFVPAMEDSARKSIMFVQAIDRKFEPFPLHRMGVGIE